MRAALVALMVLFAGLAVYFWQGSDAPLPVGPAAGEAAFPEAPATAPRARATRVEAVGAVPEGLADAPTAWLLVTDHDSGAPIAGATIRRTQSAVVIGFSDERGLAALPLQEREQLMTVADGYLLRMTPTRPGSTEREPQTISLVRDRWSATRRFEFRSAGDGAVVDEAFLRIERVDQGGDGGEAGGPPRADAVRSRAWREHGMLASLPGCADVAVCNGSVVQVLSLASGETVRFLYPGSYAVEAVTANGRAAALRLTIARSAAGGSEVVRIDLTAGTFVSGTVRAAGAPLAGAVLTRQHDDALGLQCTTGADGAFAFGPLPPGAITLLVRHPECEPLAFGPVNAPAQEVAIELRPLPLSTLRGRVRGRPDRAPVPGATVTWTAAQRPPLTTHAGADGTFRLATPGDAPGRIAVSAPGWVVYEELVDPGAALADYDLLPNAMADRLAAGMTALLAGVVLDGAGQPVAGAAVRWFPERAAAPVGMPGRRILRGGSLELPLVTSTRADGSFALETDRFGPGLLSLADASESGIATEAVAGRTRDDYRLRR